MSEELPHLAQRTNEIEEIHERQDLNHAREDPGNRYYTLPIVRLAKASKGSILRESVRFRFCHGKRPASKVPFGTRPLQ